MREAMELGPLRGAVVLGGSGGLDRVVTAVNVLETDDAPRLLVGNELLISAFYAVRDDLNAMLRWLDQLAARGCAGVILCYIGRYFEKDIEALAQRADILCLPLLTIPDNENVLYSDIMSSVLAELLNRQTKRLQYALVVQNRLTQEALLGASLDNLISSLSELVRSTVVATDADLQVIAQSAFGFEGKALLNRLLDDGEWRPGVLRGALQIGRQQTGRTSAVTTSLTDVLAPQVDVFVQPIQVERTLAGHLFAFKHGSPIDEIEEYALQVGLTVIALERMRTMSVRETERRLQSDFVDEILRWSTKSPEAMMSKAQALGLDLQDKRLVMVVSVDDAAGAAGSEGVGANADSEACRETVFQIVQRVVRFESDRSLAFSRGSRTLILVGLETWSVPSTSIKNHCAELGQLILSEFRTARDSATREMPPSHRECSTAVPGAYLGDADLSIGVGSVGRNFSALHQSYCDALQAIEVGRRLFGGGHVMHIDDVSLYTVLGVVSERKETRTMVEDILGPIKVYDSINGTDLLKTLELLCLSGESGRDVARKLFIHRNTLSYRQARIKDLLGFDPFVGHGRVRVEVALMLDKLIGS